MGHAHQRESTKCHAAGTALAALRQEHFSGVSRQILHLSMEKGNEWSLPASPFVLVRLCLLACLCSQFLWWPKIRRNFSRKRLQERQQIRALLSRQEVQNMNFLVQVRVGVARSDIEVNRLFQVLYAGITHIRSRLRNIAERRRLELPLICVLMRDREQSHIGELPHVHADTNIMKIVIGEEGVLFADAVAC